MSRRGAGYATEEEAALRAGEVGKRRELAERIRWRKVLGDFVGPEYGGRIYVDGDGRYGYSMTEGASPEELAGWHLERGASGYQPMRIAGMCRPHEADLPEGARTVAYWHTHPNSGGFSREDLRYASVMKKSLYLMRNMRWPGQGWVLERVSPSGETQTIGDDRER